MTPTNQWVVWTNITQLISKKPVIQEKLCSYGLFWRAPAIGLMRLTAKQLLRAIVSLEIHVSVFNVSSVKEKAH